MRYGFFGDLFDFNQDGELDVTERAFDFMALEEMIKEDELRAELEDEGIDLDEFDF